MVKHCKDLVAKITFAVLNILLHCIVLIVVICISNHRRLLCEWISDCSSTRLRKVMEQRCCRWWEWAASDDGQLGGLSEHQFNVWVQTQ